MSTYRIAIGRFWHESNSFCSRTTEIDAFLGGSAYSGTSVGAQVLDYGDLRNEVAGFVETLQSDGRIEIIPTLSSGATPSGLVTDDAVAELDRILREQLRAAEPLDGICFALHGAMSGVSDPDLDGYFIEVMRDEVGRDVPIVIALDCHAVVTQRMVDLSTAITAYRTHPHVDLAETGARAARMLLDILDGKTRPTMAAAKLPMLFSDSGFEKQPLKDIFDLIAQWDEMDGVINCSLCPSFPCQDAPEQGWEAIAVTNDDPALAQRLANELAMRVWPLRHELRPPKMWTVEEAIREAIQVDGCPVLITDPADNVGGGALGDTTTLLAALLEHRHEVNGLIITSLPDADAIDNLVAREVGDVVEVEVGGKLDTHFSKPLAITARVEAMETGPIKDDASADAGATVEVGRIVSLAIDNVRLVLTDMAIMGPKPSLYRKVGIEPFDAKFAGLKTGTGYQQTFAHVMKAIFVADCPGAMSYNTPNLDFKMVRRPIFPLDMDCEWPPEPPKLHE